MNNHQQFQTVSVPIIDKNGIRTSRKKRVDSIPPAIRAHTIRVPQAAKNHEDAEVAISNTLDLVHRAIARRDRVLVLNLRMTSTLATRRPSCVTSIPQRSFFSKVFLWNTTLKVSDAQQSP
jgi:hypothetical protein